MKFVIPVAFSFRISDKWTLEFAPIVVPVFIEHAWRNFPSVAEKALLERLVLERTSILMLEIVLGVLEFEGDSRRKIRDWRKRKKLNRIGIIGGEFY